MTQETFALLLLIYFVVSTILHIHGIVISFQKKWYLGLAAILVPGFATIVSIAKLVFKKDILK